jgi:hypothetical protein
LIVSWKGWVSQLEHIAATTVVVLIIALLLAPVVAILVAKVFYRREITDFTLGASGYPVLGPVVGAVACGASALVSFLSLRGSHQESEGTMLAFLFSILGLLVLSGLALWNVLS